MIIWILYLKLEKFYLLINFESCRRFNKKELQSLEIAVLYSKIPVEIKKEIISPYISVNKDEARISVRIKRLFRRLPKK